MSEAQLRRVRRLCLALPETSERLSHGEPTFFVHKRVFAMFSNNHHSDGRVAVWLPAPPGAQAARIAEDPQAYFRPPYVGHRGWLGIVLDRISDDELGAHLSLAWELTAPKRLLKSTPPRPRA
jgi:hypothetical protein